MFTNALYYPSIDITNDAWLKTAVLFWDSIQTIVPESLPNPYKYRTSLELYNEGFLKPYHVNSNMEEVYGMEHDIFEYVKTSEGKKSLTNSSKESSSDFINSKIISYLKNNIGQHYFDCTNNPLFPTIHVAKIPWFLLNEICNVEDYIKRNGAIKVNQDFLNYYMTILANRICQNNNLALLTDSVIANNFSNKIVNEKLTVLECQNIENKKVLGFMYKVIMENNQIDPSTPINKLLKFKENRKDELKLFRDEISNLTHFDSDGMNINDIENTLKVVYQNKVEPSIKNIEKTLKEERIAWIKGQIASYVFSGIIPVLITSDLNILKSIALSLSFGTSITLSVISYKDTMKIAEKKEPYTYLLKLKQLPKK